MKLHKLTPILIIIVLITGAAVHNAWQDQAQEECETWTVDERVLYLKDTGEPGVKRESVKYNVSCGDITKTVYTDKTFPLGSNINLEWVQI